MKRRIMNWISLFKEDPLTAINTVPLIIWISLTALGAIALSLQPSEGQTQAATEEKTPSSLDTFIPRGFVLIPIELENYNSVDSILGPYGVVDLFRSGQNYKYKARPIARRIKILRAPQNPSQFAVLVPEAEAPIFFQQGSVFFAAILNPKETGTAFEKERRERTTKAPRPRSIVVFEREN